MKPSVETGLASHSPITTTYKWFWDVYTNAINLSTQNDEEIVMMDDIFRIMTFIHPRAVKNLLRTPPMLRNFIFIREKAKMRAPWVETRHHLYYIWPFFGFWILLNSYPSYDSTGNNNILESTRWISHLMTMESFFDEYAHFYLIKQEEKWSSVLIVRIATYVCIQLAMGSRSRWFLWRNKNLQWCESGRFIKIMSHPKIYNHNQGNLCQN